jgi:hypothetical protein
VNTIPQIFVDGQLVGSADLFDAWRRRVQERVSACVDTAGARDPYSFCRPGCTALSVAPHRQPQAQIWFSGENRAMQRSSLAPQFDPGLNGA